MNVWALLAIGVVLTIGTGFFVASEFTLVNMDRADLESRQEKGEKGLSTIIGALRRTSTNLSSAQLGITITTLLAGFAFEPAFSELLRPIVAVVRMPDAVVHGVTTVLGVAVATVISMIVGELTPKNLALALPLATAKVVIPFQVAFTAVFRPAVAVLNGTSTLVLHQFGIEPKEELSSARSAEELSSLVRRSAARGALDQQTASLLARTIEFSELTAADVMSPRPRVTTLERGDTAYDVVEAAKQTGHSRFPVIDDTVDDIVGLVHLKQAVAVPRARRRSVPVSALQTDVLRVPETMHLDTLLGQLRSRSYQLAVVVDEYGGTSGVATLEDLVEELIGEVADEHDRSLAGVVRLHDGSWILPGMLRPDEILDRTGLDVPESGDYETLGGYVMSVLGTIPTVGDTIELGSDERRDGDRGRTDERSDDATSPARAARLVVERMDGRRVDRVRYIPASGPVDPDAATRGGPDGE